MAILNVKLSVEHQRVRTTAGSILKRLFYMRYFIVLLFSSAFFTSSSV